MTNKELVKMLREGPYLDMGKLLHEAATRIEALEDEIEKANTKGYFRAMKDIREGQV